VIEDRLAGIVQWLESVAPRRHRQSLDNSMDVSMITEYNDIVF
jgi:hypothetical protein